MFVYFRADLVRYFAENYGGRVGLRSLVYAFFEMSLWAIAIFRYGKWASRVPWRWVRAPLSALYFLLYKFSEMVTGIRISIDSEIGPGLVIHNFGGILIHARIGENCLVNQGAQMISRGDGKGSGWPVLGDDVYVGAGAKLVGSIRIGHRVLIGANTVVRHDVPDDSIVSPPPCIVKPRIRRAAAGA